mgnify:CR=1 FL=1
MRFFKIKLWCKNLFQLHRKQKKIIILRWMYNYKAFSDEK